MLFLSFSIERSVSDYRPERFSVLRWINMAIAQVIHIHWTFTQSVRGRGSALMRLVWQEIAMQKFGSPRESIHGAKCASYRNRRLSHE
jgi:hypothetical protein